MWVHKTEDRSLPIEHFKYYFILFVAYKYNKNNGCKINYSRRDYPIYSGGVKNILIGNQAILL